MAYDFSQRIPEVHPNTFVANSAQVLGKVIIAENASIWHNCVLRGDINDIYIGESTNIQDNTVIHVADDYKAIIGKGVTVGHSAIIHACTIGDNCLIGMGSIVMDGVVIGNDCIVAAGALVAPGKVYPDRSMIIGSPAFLKRQLSDDEVQRIHISAKKYIEVWQGFVNSGIAYYKVKKEIQL